MDKPAEKFDGSVLNDGILLQGIFDSLVVKRPDREASEDRVLEVVRLLTDQYRVDDRYWVDGDHLLVRYLREGKVSGQRLNEEIARITGVEAVGMQSIVHHIVDNDLQDDPAAWIPVWGHITAFFSELIDQLSKERKCSEKLELYRDFLLEHCKQESFLIHDRAEGRFSGSYARWQGDCFPQVVSQWLLVGNCQNYNEQGALLRVDIARALYWAALYEHFLSLYYEHSLKGSEVNQRAGSRLMLWMPCLAGDHELLELSTERLFNWLRVEWHSLPASRAGSDSDGKSSKPLTWSQLYCELAKRINRARNLGEHHTVDRSSQASEGVDPVSLGKTVSRWRKNEKALHAWEFAELLSGDDSAADCFVAAFVNHFSSLQKQALKAGFSPEKVAEDFARYPSYLETVSHRFECFKSDKRIWLD